MVINFVSYLLLHLTLLTYLTSRRTPHHPILYLVYLSSHLKHRMQYIAVHLPSAGHHQTIPGYVISDLLPRPPVHQGVTRGRQLLTDQVQTLALQGRVLNRVAEDQVDV